MNNAQYSYFTEIEIALQKVGYTVQPEEKGSCQLNGMTADCANSPMAAASASERMILQTLQQKWLEARLQIFPVWSGST
ncbi:hypothetical protein WKS99_01250 [Flintibacter sp. HCN-6482]|uniref:hypothetical protein n=1 Tax=Flintibacter sp. HCN-6482 TaxID=3134672 RepID=UPI0030C2F50E